MIQELKIKNFLSFKDEITFSFEATKDTFAEDYQVVEVASGVRPSFFLAEATAKHRRVNSCNPILV